MAKSKKQRVIAYVDGFNLYYGLKEKGWKRYYWLDLKELVTNLLKPNQQLQFVKYFSARLSSGDAKDLSINNISEMLFLSIHRVWQMKRL